MSTCLIHSFALVTCLTSVEVPIEAVEIPAAPRLKRMMVGLGWWSAADTARWTGKSVRNRY